MKKLLLVLVLFFAGSFVFAGENYGLVTLKSDTYVDNPYVDVLMELDYNKDFGLFSIHVIVYDKDNYNNAMALVIADPNPAYIQELWDLFDLLKNHTTYEKYRDYFSRFAPLDESLEEVETYIRINVE